MGIIIILIFVGICFAGVIFSRPPPDNDKNKDFYDANDYKPLNITSKKRYSEPGEIAEPEKLIVTVPTEFSPNDDYTVEVNDGRGWKKINQSNVVMREDGTTTVNVKGGNKVSVSLWTYQDDGNYTVEPATYDVRKKFTDLLPLRTRPFQTYQIKGKNSYTGRQKSYRIAAYDETYAIKKAKERGLLEPFEITVCGAPPTPKQRQFMTDLGMTVKPEFTKYDVSCILDRTYGGEPAPDRWLMDFALDNDIPFSLYATNHDVLYHIRNEYFIDSIHEIAFWLYVVDRFANGVNYFNANKYTAISEKLCADAEFMRNYERARKGGNLNYVKPNKRIKVYQLAKEALT